MSVPAPHFFLISKANREDKQGYWSFVLRAADGSATLEAEDCEPQVQGERLDLLAVVRGLEALDQPSRVTLVTPSSYVKRGIAYGLDEWNHNDWTWESFGQLVPVKNRDLWQRLDRALRIHKVEGPIRRLDPPHRAGEGKNGAAPGDHLAERRQTRNPSSPAGSETARHRRQDRVARHRFGAVRPPDVRRRSRRRVRSRFRWLLASGLRGFRRQVDRWRLACAQLGTTLLPAPWLD